MPGDVIKIDIATRFLRADEDIYVIRPGEGFSLYNDFIGMSSVFLDFPDIGLSFDRPPPARERFRELVVRSIEIRNWLLARKPDPAPSRDILDYAEKAKGKRIGTYVGAIKKLYFELPIGTIIVVPGPGYFSDVRIGEIVGPTELSRQVRPYIGESVPIRRVRWLGQKPKAAFSEKLRDRLQKPTPLMTLDRSLRQQILEAAYDQFVIGDTYSCRFRTTNADFSTLDDYDLQTFINYVSGVLAAGEIEPDALNVKMLDALGYLRERRDLIPELTSNINSPGALRLFNEHVTPIVVAAFLAMAVAAAAPAGELPASIKIVNSATVGDDPCALVVQAHAENAIRMMDLDTWKSVCVQARDGAKSSGLSTTITVVPDAEEQ